MSYYSGLHIYNGLVVPNIIAVAEIEVWQCASDRSIEQPVRGKPYYLERRVGFWRGRERPVLSASDLPGKIAKVSAVPLLGKRLSLILQNDKAPVVFPT